jgi:hypothetical protein
VQVQIDECKAILDAQKPPPDTTANTTTTTTSTTTDSASTSSTSVAPEPTPATPSGPEGRAWWKDPVGGALVGAGAVGVGLGVVFLVQGHSADQDKANAMTYDEYKQLNERATSRGQLGMITLVAGGALVTTGVVWYVTHKPASSTTVTGWLDGNSGGIAVSGGF